MVTLDEIASLCKRRGFVYPTSEIYGGLMSSYDYGPLGAELLRNIKNAWWKTFVQDRSDMVGIDSQILLHPQTWVASGHVGSFSDPLVEDTVTHKRYRADHLIEAWQKDHPEANVAVEDLTIDQMAEFMRVHKVESPDGNPISAPKQFNLLFETKLGVVEGEKALLYLRGETAQGIFTNFKNIVNSNRVTLPFGVGQIGKSFRNEITTGQFIFRTLELEQGEIEYFFDPETTPWEELFNSWKDSMWKFVTTVMGIDETHIRWRKHTDKERSHYSKDTYDLDYLFSFGWKELWGIAYRTDYDLTQQAKHSGADLSYVDSATGRKFIPHVIEPAVGINRLFLMAMTEAYVKEEKRIVLKLAPKIAPYKVAVFPLVANKPELADKAREIYTELKTHFSVAWDDRGNIGKRYLSQDEIGTPWCVTVDYATLEDGSVTVRDRDTTKQERIKVADLTAYFQQKLV
ncbi:glycine--tRNA ligase [Candidatus Gottesmanbacteria bacterium]|nr:glycine--tRNA ligase [Candidatus Gottesmanbacteria bacterium]